MQAKVKEAIRKAMRGRTLFDAPVAPFTTFRIGGPADAIVFPASVEELSRIAKILREADETVRTIGRGSKLLVRDGGFRGALVCLCEGFTAIDVEEGGPEVVRVRAEAGAHLPTLAAWSAQSGLAGLEWVQGIPGSVGGAVLMNAGAFGGRTSEVLREIEVLDGRTGDTETVGGRELASRFRYRALDIDTSLVVVRASFDLHRDDPDAIEARMKENREKRRRGQPLDLPSAGSIFKNPEGVKVGLLIEEAGLKGRRRGNAAISEMHGNFILNLGDAKASDVLGLIEDIRTAIRERHGIELELELRVLGEEGAASGR